MPISCGVLATMPPNACECRDWRGIVKQIKKSALLSASKGELHHVDVARGTMSDPVKTPSETSNKPAVETPVAAAAKSVATPPADPTASKPAIETPLPAAAAATTEQPVTDQAAADKAAADKAIADAAAAAEAETKAKSEAEAKIASDAVAKAAADKAAADLAAGNVIPENYEIKLKDDVQVDPALIPALTPALKKAGLTQSQLQTVAESFIEFQGQIAPRMLARDLDLTMKDPEIGGLNYGRTQGHVNAALGAFTHPEFRSLLQKAGLANNLEFVRVFERIGKAMQGDSAARGSPDGAPESSRAERMYGKTAPNT